MLLGLSDEKQDQDWVLKEMQRQQSQYQSLNLAAWATAYLEIVGKAGIDDLSDRYIGDARRSRDELRLITRAMAGHANHNPTWIEPVVDVYRELLNTHPSSAPDIAHDLIAWKQWEFSQQMQQLLPQLTENDPLGAAKVELFLKQSQMRVFL